MPEAGKLLHGVHVAQRVMWCWYGFDLPLAPGANHADKAFDSDMNVMLSDVPWSKATLRPDQVCQEL